MGATVIEIITPQTAGQHLDEIIGMFRLRHRVFRERLGWDVTTSGDMEMDLYDRDPAAHYLIHRGSDGAVTGCVRLLPTTGPYMLRDTFPVLLDGVAAPAAALVWEASRFAVDHVRPATSSAAATAAGLTRATVELVAGVAEWAATRRLSAVVAVVDVRMERILRRAGWPLTRFGPPRPLGVTRALAGTLAVTEATVSTIHRAGGLTSSVLARPLGATRAA